MTKDEIMKLALESGFAKILDEHASEYRDFTFELSQDHYPELGRFVNLIAAHKTEIALTEAYRCGHEAGAVEEREACAKLCDDLDDDIVDGLAGWQYAEAIRARGTT